MTRLADLDISRTEITDVFPLVELVSYRLRTVKVYDCDTGDMEGLGELCEEIDIEGDFGNWMCGCC